MVVETLWFGFALAFHCLSDWALWAVTESTMTSEFYHRVPAAQTFLQASDP